jgi:hypothetical protein
VLRRIDHGNLAHGESARETRRPKLGKVRWHFHEDPPAISPPIVRGSSASSLARFSFQRAMMRSATPNV